MATKFLKRHGRTTSEVIAVEQPSDTYTKLTNASAPRSRGQFWDDVTPEGGGGSAFAHLSEDAENSWVRSDWYIESIGADVGFEAKQLDDGSGGMAGLYSVGTLYLQEDGIGYLTLHGSGRLEGDLFFGSDKDHALLHLDPTDGSLHWGDGTAAPDIAIERFDDGAGVILINNGSGAGPTSYFGADGTVWALTARDFSGPYVGLTPNNIYINNGTQDKTIIVDDDGDLAINGVGKIAIQP